MAYTPQPLDFHRLPEPEMIRRARELREELSRRRTVRDFSTELKAKIRAAAEAEEQRSYDGRMSAEWLAALEHLGTDWRKPHLSDAPYLIVVFEQVWGYHVDPDGTARRIKHYYAEPSVGIAVGFLLAALHHAGLATLTHTPSPMGFLRTTLDRPDNERAFVIIPVGYPADDAVVPAITKKPLDQILVRR